MENCPSHIEPWTRMLLGAGGYPAPARLAGQFDAAKITRLCECGCNSFDVEVVGQKRLRPLVLPQGQGGMIFETNLVLDDGRQIALLVFCDKDGNLAGVDVDFEGNSAPVPSDLVFSSPPVPVYSSPHILPD